MGTKIVVSTNANVACGGATPKSVLGYKAPSGIAARVLRYGVSLNGTSSTDARAKVDFLKKPSTAGTATDISTEIAVVSGKTTSLGNAFQSYNVGFEPGQDGSSRVLRSHLMAPTGPFETLAGIDLDPAELITLRVYDASGKECRAWMEVELG